MTRRLPLTHSGQQGATTPRSLLSELLPLHLTPLVTGADTAGQESGGREVKAMRFPATIFEFQEQFPSETACWQYLRRLRWPRGFRCPRCGHDRSYFLERRRLEQ